MPVCPYCKQEITTLYCSLRRDLVWFNERWVLDVSDGGAAIGCSSCYEELGPRDLDKLGVPDEFR